MEEDSQKTFDEIVKEEFNFSKYMNVLDKILEYIPNTMKVYKLDTKNSK